jgi:hypothetical protein
LADINEILDEYKLQRPLTLRQIWYRLIAQYGHTKDEAKGRFYDGTLSNTLVRARRAEFRTNDGVPLFQVIRDDELIRRSPFYYADQDNFWSTMKREAAHYTQDRQRGQARQLVLWCETAGMVPQLQRIAAPLGISVFSSGKFDGVMAKHNLGLEWSKYLPRTILHIGDHDPSGIHIFEALARDVIRFSEQMSKRRGRPMPDLEFIRLAVLPGQVVGIEPDERNWEDNRRFEWVTTRLTSAGEEDHLTNNPNETWQAEAIAPNDLAALVQDAIDQRFNYPVYQEVRKEEERTRHLLAQRLEIANKLMVRGN